MQIQMDQMTTLHTDQRDCLREENESLKSELQVWMTPCFCLLVWTYIVSCIHHSNNNASIEVASNTYHLLHTYIGESVTCGTATNGGGDDATEHEGQSCRFTKAHKGESSDVNIVIWLYLVYAEEEIS